MSFENLYLIFTQKTAKKISIFATTVVEHTERLGKSQETACKEPNFQAEYKISEIKEGEHCLCDKFFLMKLDF